MAILELTAEEQLAAWHLEPGVPSQEVVTQFITLTLNKTVCGNPVHVVKDGGFVAVLAAFPTSPVSGDFMIKYCGMTAALVIEESNLAARSV